MFFQLKKSLPLPPAPAPPAAPATAATPMTAVPAAAPPLRSPGSPAAPPNVLYELSAFGLWEVCASGDRSRLPLSFWRLLCHRYTPSRAPSPATAAATTPSVSPVACAV